MSTEKELEKKLQKLMNDLEGVKASKSYKSWLNKLELCSNILLDENTNLSKDNESINDSYDAVEAQNKRLYSLDKNSADYHRVRMFSFFKRTQCTSYIHIRRRGF